MKNPYCLIPAFFFMFNQILTAQEVIFFNYEHEEPFYPQLESQRISYDTNLVIRLMDGNGNGSFSDVHNVPNQDSCCDYINIQNKNNSQQHGVNFTPELIFENDGSKYSFVFNPLLQTGFLKKLTSNNSKASLSLFNKVPPVEIRELKNSSSWTTIPQLALAASTKYVFFSFWSPFCPPCVEDLAFYDEYINEITKANLTVIHISTNEYPADCREHVQKNNHKGLFYTCSRKEMETFNCSGYPSGFLTDNQGKYIRHVGWMTISDILNKLPTLKS
ncbi:MAG: redoxin domain-containing protein [Saprospiraceae bacterium]|nr:redoxin domain-containing protein [Saprospiraceae bacterium]